MRLDCFSVPVETRGAGGTTNAYLVGREDCLLIDPAGRTDPLDEAIAERGVSTIAVTHTHPDHVGAVADYTAKTGATLLARRPDRMQAATGVEPDSQILDGETVQAGSSTATVLDTPGHAVDHVAFELGNERRPTIISGDLAVADGSVVVGAPEGDLRAYLTSLRRLRARKPRRLFPGHGPAMDKTGVAPREALERLLSHRLSREASVLGAVQAGASDLDSVVNDAYEKELSGVRDLARATVRAHIEKLVVEGAVTWDPESGRVGPN